MPIRDDLRRVLWNNPEVALVCRKTTGVLDRIGFGLNERLREEVDRCREVTGDSWEINEVHEIDHLAGIPSDQLADRLSASEASTNEPGVRMHFENRARLWSAVCRSSMMILCQWQRCADVASHFPGLPNSRASADELADFFVDVRVHVLLLEEALHGLTMATSVSTGRNPSIEYGQVRGALFSEVERVVFGYEHPEGPIYDLEVLEGIRAEVATYYPRCNTEMWGGGYMGGAMGRLRVDDPEAGKTLFAGVSMARDEFLDRLTDFEQRQLLALVTGDARRALLNIAQPRWSSVRGRVAAAWTRYRSDVGALIESIWSNVIARGLDQAVNGHANVFAPLPRGMVAIRFAGAPCQVLERSSARLKWWTLLEGGELEIKRLDAIGAVKSKRRKRDLEAAYTRVKTALSAEREVLAGALPGVENLLRFNRPRKSGNILYIGQEQWLTRIHGLPTDAYIEDSKK